jgi:hypothetical protein
MIARILAYLECAIGIALSPTTEGRVPNYKTKCRQGFFRTVLHLSQSHNGRWKETDAGKSFAWHSGTHNRVAHRYSLPITLTCLLPTSLPLLALGRRGRKRLELRPARKSVLLRKLQNTPAGAIHLERRVRSLSRSTVSYKLCHSRRMLILIVAALSNRTWPSSPSV